MLSDEWLSRYGLLENFNASVTRTRTGTGTGTWTTGVTAIALCTSWSRAKNYDIFMVEINALYIVLFNFISLTNIINILIKRSFAPFRFFHIFK